MSKIYSHQQYADGVIIQTDDVKFTLEESSNTYSGVDAVLASKQSIHMIVDSNNDGGTVGGFTIRSRATTIDASDEVFKVKPNGELTISNAYNMPTSDGANGTFLFTDGSGQTYWGYQMNVIVANTIAAGTGVDITGDSNTGWIINIGQNVATTANVSFNIVTADLVGDVTGDVTGDITSTGTSTFTTVDINGGNIDGTTIGATTASTIRGTTITATTGFTGNVTGDVTGNVTGDVTGDLTGDVTGDVTGNVTGDVTGQVSDISNHNTDDLSEGITNLYYTDSRARAAISASGDLSYDINTGVISYTAVHYDSSNFSTDLATKTTNDLSEGNTNLYYTDSRVHDALSAGDGLDYANGEFSVANNIATKTYVDTADSYKLDTADFTATANTWLATRTTTNLTEGSNLYYTDARVRAALSVSGDLSYDINTGVISFTESAHYNSNNFNTDFSAKNTDNLSEGNTNVYFTDARVMTSLGSVTAHIIPNGNEVYDLGEPSNKFRDLYLSSGTIYMGDTSISANGSTIELPAGSKVGGVVINSSVAPEVDYIEYVNTSSSTSTYNFSSGQVVREYKPQNNWTANIINTNISSGQSVEFKIIVVQDSVAKMPTAIQLDGIEYGIFWAEGTTPTGTNEGVDVITYQILKDNSNKYYIIASSESKKVKGPSYSAPTVGVTGLVAYYNPADPDCWYDYYGEQSTIKDLSGNDLHATVDTTQNFQTSSGIGYFDYYASNQFTTPDLSTLIPDENHSVEIWVRADASGDNVWSYIGDTYHVSGTSIIQTGPFQTFQASIWTPPSTLERANYNAGYLLNNWYQLIRVYNAITETHITYVNGALESSVSASWTSPHVDYSEPFKIRVGNAESTTYSVNAGAFDGGVGILRIYNKALSSSEVTTLWNNTKTLYNL